MRAAIVLPACTWNDAPNVELNYNPTIFDFLRNFNAAVD
jgi:hypothetical protein